ncbi:MAG TPA: hypothetical protein VHY34_09170 [Caulobacteraceae bacterium]|nr:hypothetical protein [Caulobacteraceae bacterium]
MTNVIAQQPVQDANCLVVWTDPTGHPVYGSLYSYQCGHPVAHLDTTEEWDAAVDTAVTLAERNGIPTVYVIRE